MFKILMISLLSVLLSAEVYDGVAIVVQDKAITLYDIKKEMKTSHLDAKKASDVLIRQKLEQIETKVRKITVTSAEVYDDIKKMASRNKMNISEFYEAVRESNGLTSRELKVKVKNKLLSQKLYNAISYSSMQEPSEDEIKEYYELHKSSFKHPSSFTVIIYQSNDKQKLQEKVENPMFYSPEIKTNEQVLPYNRISPELASLLERTHVDHYTAVVPDGKGGYMSFYLKDEKSAKESSLESIKTQLINAMMAERREQVLGDYFARLRHNADINIIRMPK
jgi:hypothetical protein